ncbi:hypothetical protein [Streptomyces sp. DH12]|uniref:hypothetical protein n=1 Tax=Streptomyces sp. DH12 TaxID=2857010 RepID=UPI001E4CB5FB|nr:hypothetical protein [Streptomyces sp. DH12]
MYRLTYEDGTHRVVSRLALSRFLRLAAALGSGQTPVRRGWVVTLPGGSLVAVIKEAP